MGGFKKIEVDNSNFGNVVSYEMATELKENIDLLQMAIPVGEIITILVNLPNVPVPNPDIWQECNGSEIVHPSSPLRSMGALKNYVPDLREKYIKVPKIFGESGQFGGYNNNYIFRHNHAGVTYTHVAPEEADGGGNQRMAAREHAHSIDYSFDYAVNVEPPFFTLKWFMRIQ